MCVSIIALLPSPQYGLSREISDTNYYTLKTGRALPIRWTAPEVLLTVRWDVSTDVYSFGVLVAETFTRGEIPFDRHEDPEFLEPGFLTLWILKVSLCELVGGIQRGV